MLTKLHFLLTIELGLVTDYLLISVPIIVSVLKFPPWTLKNVLEFLKYFMTSNSHIRLLSLCTFILFALSHVKSSSILQHIILFLSAALLYVHSNLSERRWYSESAQHIHLTSTYHFSVFDCLHKCTCILASFH